MDRKSRVRNLRCDVCGAEIVISASGDYRWHPIYCCGLEIHGDETARTPVKAPAPRKKATAAPPVKAPARKRTPGTKTVASGKKATQPAPEKGRAAKKTAASRKVKKK